MYVTDNTEIRVTHAIKQIASNQLKLDQGQAKC